MKKLLLTLLSLCLVVLITNCETDNSESELTLTNDNMLNNRADIDNPIIQTFPTLLLNRKWMETAGSGWHCGSYFPSVCTYIGNGEWMIAYNDGKEDLKEGTVTSLIEVSVYDELIEINVIKYSDKWMYNEKDNTFNLDKDIYLKMVDKDGDVLERYGIKSIKLEKGSYKLIPNEKSKKSIGRYYINAKIDFE